MDGAVEEHVAISENGKFYIQGLLDGRIFAGEVVQFESQVKNHMSKKVGNVFFSLFQEAGFIKCSQTTGLNLSLTRSLAVLNVPIQLSDTLYS